MTVPPANLTQAIRDLIMRYFGRNDYYQGQKWEQIPPNYRELANDILVLFQQRVTASADLAERARGLLPERWQHLPGGEIVVASIAAALQSEREAERAEARRAALSEFRNRVSIRLNNHLVEMKPGYDDSITGFNEAWDIFIHGFDESLERL